MATGTNEEIMLSKNVLECLSQGVSSLDPERRGYVDCRKVAELFESLTGKALSSVDRRKLNARAEVQSRQGLLNLVTFRRIMAESLEQAVAPQWGKLRLIPSGEVGINHLQDQIQSRVLRHGYQFNVMVVGRSGLGKSTLINTLFQSQVSRRSNLNIPSELPKDCGDKINPIITAVNEMPKTTEVKSVSHVIQEKGVSLRLTVTDTPGFGDNVNNDNCWVPILEYLTNQFDKYLQEEQCINRKRSIPDTRIHCCLYFIAPTGHRLKPLDIAVMRRLDRVVNIIPVISKADTLTLEERTVFKESIRCDLEKYGIRIFPCLEFEDQEDSTKNDDIRSKMPFAVVGSAGSFESPNGMLVLGRKTQWGLVEVENRNHCEFSDLRDLIIRTHMHDLVEVTSSFHYESFRQSRLQESTHQSITNGHISSVDIDGLNESNL